MWDETLRELCERCFRPLVEEKQAGKRDYKRAFFAATDAMRHPAHLPLLEDSVSTAEKEEHSGSSRRESERSTATDAIRWRQDLQLLEDCVSTAEQEEHCGSSRRGSVGTCIFLMGLFLIWTVPALLIVLKDYKCSSKHNAA